MSALDFRAARSDGVAVNVNARHLDELMGPERAAAAALMAGDGRRFSASEIGNAFDDIERVSRGKDHYVASGLPLGGLVQSFLADVALAAGAVVLDSNGIFQPQFSGRDYRHLGAFGEWTNNNVAGPATAPFGVDSAALGSSARIALFGDWAAGTLASIDVASAISADEIDLAIHLGDVYYSGTRRETTEYLVDGWPRGARFGRVCTSNHEMFSGGRAQRELSFPLVGQQYPTFVLQNRHWTLVGLDTGSTFGGLGPEQVTLLRKCVRDQTRRMVLVSHYPLLDSTLGVSDRLLAEVADVLASGRVAAWYWAHEHACLLFDDDPRFPGLRFRCLGHGGFPYLEPADPTCVARPAPARTDLPHYHVLAGRSAFAAGHDTYGPFGWMRLDLDGPVVRETLIAQDRAETVIGTYR